MQKSAPPDLQPRPKLALYLFERDLTYRDAAEALPCSHEQVRRICLPLTDPERRLPDDDLRQAIAAWTHGVVGLSDWPALIRKRAAA